jgi:hypothetical protein
MNSRVLVNTGAVRMIIDRLHMEPSRVGAQDAAIVADMNERLDPGEWTAHERRRLISYALAVHHRNQKLYRDVMRGM